MESLEFTDIVKLLNHSRTTLINKEPTSQLTGQWELYEGEYKVHLSTTPFSVLYIQSRANTEGVTDARKRAFKPSITQVVYAPSLDSRIKAHHTLLKKDAAGFWTTREYVASFLSEELDSYRRKIIQLKHNVYTDPQIMVPAGIKRKIPNPLHNMLTDPDATGSETKGELAVLLAPPGQGKTYMSQHLVGRIADTWDNIFPIYIDSNQWRYLGIEDIGSIWKTIAHSFRYFDTPISWIEGCEEDFIKTTLKAGLFRIVFDGLDEYILRNHGRIQASDVLEALLSLVRDTGARIIVTSRTTFWDSEIVNSVTDDLLDDSLAKTYLIEPFDRNQAKDYFSKRLEKGETKIVNALNVFDSLKAHGKSFIGRGFVLNLIADLVERDDKIKIINLDSSPIQWLMHALCEREKLRQELPLDARSQIKVLRIFISDVVQGNPANTETLDYAISNVDPSLDSGTRELCISKLSPHPLLNKKSGTDEWVIP